MIPKNTITRPNDTTAYTTGDVINANGSTTPIELSYSQVLANPYILLNHLISSNQSGTPSIDVYFFSSSFTIAADNAAFAPTDDQMKDNFLGKVSHSSWSAFAANKNSSAKPEAPIGLPNSSSFSGDPKIYAVLVAAGAYTPIAEEVITIKTDIA
jgi:hypothetical protein